MTFTTITFALFLPLVFAVYWSSSRVRVQNAVLVVASFTFYGWWDYRFCALLLFTSLLDFLIGRLLHAIQAEDARRRLLVASVVANLGVLATFKYFDFFADGLRELARSLGFELSPFTLSIVLPIGVSFYTFQSLGYVIDIYRRRLEPARNAIDFLAFIAFFPQLVAGPIERARNLLEQIRRPRCFDTVLAAEGMRQMLWGVLKKTVVADNLAPIVEAAFANPSASSGPQLMLATVCFAMQIYCDFSGYSDIAIGSARLFGIALMRNFDYPYISTSLSEFWRRWHISLSSWFRDYVYIPLGGDRRGPGLRAVNILLTFTLSGLWHGAAWHFVAWGVFNGVGVAVEKEWSRRSHADATAAARERGAGVRRLAAWLATFVFICAGWVLFRAESVAVAAEIFRRIAFESGSMQAWRAVAATAADHVPVLIAAAACLGLEWAARNYPHGLALLTIPWVRGRALQPTFRWAVYTAGTLAVLQFAPFRGREFIYFQF